MKKSIFLFPTLLLLLSSMLFSGCMKDKCERSLNYTRYHPIYMSYDELRSSVASEAPRTLENPGKIYYKDQYIFVNELDKGIHVINNSDPSNPQNVSFINIPGNIDIAVKGNTLYADSYIDLVAIDISDPSNISISKRITEIFPYRTYNTYNADPAKGVVVNWIEEDVTEMVDCSQSFPGPIMFEGDMTTAGNSTAGSTGGTRSAPSIGVGGSMARFALSNGKLYTVDTETLKVFDVNNSPDPVYISEKEIGVDIETIFPYQNNLFIGSERGMYIYDITIPENPSYLSEIEHVVSCDPVVADNNVAYVTLRTGNNCQGWVNVLETYNIMNKSNPFQINSFNMTNPHGLAISNKTLFVCDGKDGLKIYNATDPNTVGNKMIRHIPGMQAYDVIALNGILLLISEDGLYQYNYTDLNNIYELSRIPVVKP